MKFGGVLIHLTNCFINLHHLNVQGETRHQNNTDFTGPLPISLQK